MIQNNHHPVNAQAPSWSSHSQVPVLSLSPSLLFLPSLLPTTSPPIPWEITALTWEGTQLSLPLTVTSYELPELPDTEPQFPHVVCGGPAPLLATPSSLLSPCFPSVSFSYYSSPCPNLWELNNQRQCQAQLMAQRPRQVLWTNLLDTQTQYFPLLVSTTEWGGFLFPFSFSD